MMNNTTKPARDMGLVALFFLIFAISVCSFSTWWFYDYTVVNGTPAVTLPTATTNAILGMNLNLQTRYMKQYTIYGVRTDTSRMVFQNNERTAEGECKTVTNEYMWPWARRVDCDFEFNSYSGFGTDAARDTAKANMQAWCDQRCDNVKATRKTTCDSVAYDISRAANGLAETEFDEELLCGGTGGGAFAMMVTVMTLGLVGLLVALLAPAMRPLLLAAGALCLALAFASAVLYGVKTTAWRGSTFHDQHGFAPDMYHNAKFGFDVGYALLVLLNLLAAALLAYLVKASPRPDQQQADPQPLPGNTNEIVFHEPVKQPDQTQTQPAPAQPLPTNATQPQPQPQPPVQYVQSPYQNMGMQTYPFVQSLNGVA